jgi:hypothetical protein
MLARERELKRSGKDAPAGQKSPAQRVDQPDLKRQA